MIGGPRSAAARRTVLLAGLLCIAAAVSATAGDPQTDRSRYFPLDHPAYDYIDRLQQRGRLTNLNPALKPYTRARVLRRVREVLADSSMPVGKMDAAWLNWLRAECEREMQALAGADSGRMTVVVRPEAGFHLRSVHPERETTRLGVGFGGAFGPVAFDTRFLRAPHLMDPPPFSDHRDPLVNPPSEEGLIRPMEGYVKAHFAPSGGAVEVELLFGRMARHWAPRSGISLLMSSDALSFDQAGLRLKAGRLEFTHLVGALDPMDYRAAPGEPTRRARRFLSAHRLDIRILERLRIGITETAVYGGPEKIWDLALMNPFTSYRALAMIDSGRWPNNAFIGFDGFWSPSPAVNVYGQFLIDDFLRDEDIQNRWGISLGADVCELPLPGTNSARLEYVRVSSFAYNTFRPWERYLVGGRPFGAKLGNDFHRFGLAVSHFPHHLLALELELAWTGRGEQRISSPVEPLLDSGRLPFPTGTVEETTELNLGVRWQIGHSGHLSALAGVLSQEGLNHRPGASRLRGAGELRLTLYHDFLIGF